MSESFFLLSATDRRAALVAAAERSGRPAHLLEKDIWVVWALGILFEAPIGPQLVFKGGTSLSKAHGVITRFSEDVDLTRDIRTVLPNEATGEEPIPPNRSQGRRWRGLIEAELVRWSHEEVGPLISTALKRIDDEGAVVVEAEKVRIQYRASVEGRGYVHPEVLLEFGARSTGEPAAPMPVACDAAGWLQGVDFPVAPPRVMAAERTFWEKATAVHAWCLKGEARGDRLARHWYDLTALERAGVAQRAFADRALGVRVARHKQAFFEMKDVSNQIVEYLRAIEGGLRLVPEGALRGALEADYARMVGEGMLPEDAPEFEELLQACGEMERTANGG